jgi:hypothetical protein
MGGSATRAIEYLRSQLPPHATSPQVMTPTRKIPPSVPEQQKFARAWSTVADPATALADLRAGRMTPIQAQTLAAVYPRIYEGLKLAVMQGIGKADASGNQLPIYVRQNLDMLLGLNGAGESAFSDRITDIVQAGLAKQTAQQQPPPRRKPPQLAKNMADTSTSLMAMT